MNFPVQANKRRCETQASAYSKNSPRKTFKESFIAFASALTHAVTSILPLMTKDKHEQSWSFREDFTPSPHSKFGKFDPRPAAQTTDEFLYNHLSPQSLEPNPNITDEQFVRRLFSPLLSAHPPLRWHVNSWIPVRGTSIRFLFKHCFQTMRATPLISTNFGLIFCPHRPVLITIFITGNR